MSKCDDFASIVEGILATETGQMAVQRIQHALFVHRNRRDIQCGGAKPKKKDADQEASDGNPDST